MPPHIGPIEVLMILFAIGLVFGYPIYAVVTCFKRDQPSWAWAVIICMFLGFLPAILVAAIALRKTRP